MWREFRLKKILIIFLLLLTAMSFIEMPVIAAKEEKNVRIVSEWDIYDVYDYKMFELKVLSAKGLEQFLERYPFELGKDYDEKFFEKKSLLFVFVRYGAEWSKYEIVSMDENATTIQVELARKIVTNGIGSSNDETFTWALVFELNNDEPEKEIWVNSELVTKKPYKTVEFLDVSDGAWYADAVKYVSWDRNIMNGSNNLFNPQGTMTRGMLVTVLWRLAGEPETETNVFTDVPEGKYYTEAVNWAAENGIVTGSGDNKFNPEGAITREQLVTILYRMAVKKGTASGTYEEFSGFEDDEAVRGYAVEAMKWAVSEGIITGSENGGKLYLNPQKNSTRAQVAAILMRYLK